MDLFRTIARFLLSFFTGYALACALIATPLALWPRLENHIAAWIFFLLLVVAFTFALFIKGRKDPGQDRLRTVTEWCVLVVLPLWGLGINCSLHVCQACEVDPSQALRTPDVLGLYLLYAASVVAYVVSRRQPRFARLVPELWMGASLIAGMILCVALAVQFGFGLVLGLVVGPVGLPLVAPVVVLILYASELIVRLRRATSPRERLYLWPLFGCSALVISAWGALHRLLFKAWPWDAFTQTCEWTFSQLTPAPGDCHYLCTIAAQGSPWLVKPTRLGRRHGHVIVVNRQLCVANAFEDLLHTRWPLMWTICRKTYDRIGLPISRLLVWRPLANLTYLLMKPAEWLFYLCLLLFDQDDPEKRIERMYR